MEDLVLSIILDSIFDFLDKFVELLLRLDQEPKGHARLELAHPDGSSGVLAVIVATSFIFLKTRNGIWLRDHIVRIQENQSIGIATTFIIRML